MGIGKERGNLGEERKVVNVKERAWVDIGPAISPQRQLK